MCDQLQLGMGSNSASVTAGRRAAIRHTWMAAAPTDVAIKFVLYEKEQNVDIMKESRLYQDIIFVPGGNTTDYRSIVFKTFAFVQVQLVVNHAMCASHCQQPVSSHTM